MKYELKGDELFRRLRSAHFGNRTSQLWIADKQGDTMDHFVEQEEKKIDLSANFESTFKHFQIRHHTIGGTL